MNKEGYSMISKISQVTETIGTETHKLITKTFQRGLDTVTTKTASFGGKVYFKSWRIDGYKRTTCINRAYDGTKPIPDTTSKLDIYG